MLVWDDIAIVAGSLYGYIVTCALVPAGARTAVKGLEKRMGKVPVAVAVCTPEGEMVRTLLTSPQQLRLHKWFVSIVQFEGLTFGNWGQPHPLPEKREKYKEYWWKFRHDEWDWEVCEQQPDPIPPLPG
jgi:hypothetical protein